MARRKLETYKGNETSEAKSWAEQLLAGTWLGNLLYGPEKTYIDGYGHEKKDASFKESANGQEAKRMAETAKNAAKITATGLAFANPLTASEAAAPLITAAQAYMVGEGLNDAKQRINENLTTNKSKTDQAGDALMVGLDLLGAYPALRSINSGWQQVAPELEKGWSVVKDYAKDAVAGVTKVGKTQAATAVQSTPRSVVKVVQPSTSKITEAERLGIPKGDRYIYNHKDEILKNAEAFAKKYGYDVPKTIEEAKNMYRQHNTVFRSVISDLPAEQLGDAVYAMNKEEQAKFLASHGYPLSMRDYWPEHAGQYVDDYVFVSPTRSANSSYTGDRMVQVQLQRPFSFGDPTKWHINADWRPSVQSAEAYPSKIGAAMNGNTGPATEFQFGTKKLIPVKVTTGEEKGTRLGDYLQNQFMKWGYGAPERFDYTDFKTLPESQRSGFTSVKVPGNDPSNLEPANEILEKILTGEITNLDEATKQLKEAYPFSFIPENFVKNAERYGTRGFLPGNGGSELLRMGSREIKTVPGELVSEFYKTDVYPRAQKTFLAGVSNINPGYDEMVYAYYPRDIGGSYFPLQRKIGINNNFDTSGTSTKVHEMNHALRRGPALEYKYTDKERSLLKKVDTPSFHYDFPDIDHNLEINATLTELRFKYWQELKSKLNRTPTIEELNTYIDKLPSSTINNDLESISGYGKSLADGYYWNEDPLFKRVKEAMKYVAGVAVPAVTIKQNDRIQNNNK